MAETRQFALVQRLSGGKTLRLAKGYTIDGWSVTSVLTDRVVFQRDADNAGSRLEGRQAEAAESEEADPQATPGDAAEIGFVGPDRTAAPAAYANATGMSSAEHVAGEQRETAACPRLGSQ